MTHDWSKPGSLELLLTFDGRLGRRAALEQSLREAIRGGRLLPGTRLPATRTLAQDLGVARGTVADAYAQLVAEGFLTARRGAGTVVAGGGARELPAQRPPRPETASRYDLRPGTPDLSLFPRDSWLRALRDGLRAAPDEVLGYGDPRGLLLLRQRLVEHLSRTRGVSASPDHVVICAGFRQGLDLLSRALRARGVDALAVEDPGLPQHHALVRAAGLRTVPLAVDGEGARVDQLASSGARAALLTPAHQYPLGVPLSGARRSTALEWARAAGGVIVEDDYDGEFRYDGPPVGALQALDPEHVVYGGTASKCLAPGVRLAWLVVPSWLIEPVADLKRVVDATAPVLDQLALAELLRTGAYGRHVRRCRLVYSRRRDQLVETLAHAAPESRVTGIAAGLHAIVELPAGAGAEGEVEERAALRDLAISGLRRHRVGGADAGAALVVAYARPPSHAYAGALAALAGTLRATS